MLCVAPVATGERERGEQTRHAVIEDGQIFPAGLVAERAGEPAFADAAGAGDQQIVPRADPVAGGELEEERAVEPARQRGSRRPRRWPAWRSRAARARRSKRFCRRSVTSWSSSRPSHSACSRRAASGCGVETP